MTPTVRVTGNQLPVYFQGRHRSVYLKAFGQIPQPSVRPLRRADWPDPRSITASGALLRSLTRTAIRRRRAQS